MPPRTATWDKIQWVKTTIMQEMVNGVLTGNAQAVVEWSVSTQSDQFPMGGSKQAPLNATRQNQANLIMGDSLAFAKAQEGIP